MITIELQLTPAAMMAIIATRDVGPDGAYHFSGATVDGWSLTLPNGPISDSAGRPIDDVLTYGVRTRMTGAIVISRDGSATMTSSRA